MLALFLAAGCGAPPQETAGDRAQTNGAGGSTEATSEPNRGATPPAKDTDESSDDGHLKIKGDAAPFVTESEANGGTPGAADRIRRIRFQAFEDYDRAYIGFGDGVETATGVPRWTLEKPSEGGYLRIRFPGIASTALGDNVEHQPSWRTMAFLR